jgi:hypothetical protein
VKSQIKKYFEMRKKIKTMNKIMLPMNHPLPFYNLLLFGVVLVKSFELGVGGGGGTWGNLGVLGT